MYEPVVKIGSFGYSKSAMIDSMAKTAVSAHHRVLSVLPASFYAAFQVVSRSMFRLVTSCFLQAMLLVLLQP